MIKEGECPSIVRPFAKQSYFFYNIPIMSMQKPFYEKFVKKPSAASASRTQDKSNRSQPEETRPRRQSKDEESYRKHSPQRANRKGKNLRENRSNTSYSFGKPVFSALTAEAKSILEHFPALLDQVLPLDAKKNAAAAAYSYALP
ncbi:hypothetical protein TREVI0001_0529 [Treponema vincentii ATCC 35580]|uniref:Uncharacterized protein n=1 Tax=Treponema vincentii ATCC 35580 TaxID=596324 RepID=C8PMB5_9SPIR|nr:hypothetical protein [Treponema vincentii]EEV21332.1 hypothetical protein TREVI0001_0529 [Treponema vincentii ATCC 35580]